MRIEAYPRFHPFIPNSSKSAVQMIANFIMNRQYICPRIFEWFYEGIRVDDHQMDIQRFGCYLFYGLNHRQSKGDIGNKYPVHHIKMNPVGLALINHENIPAKIVKIGSQD